MFDINILLDKLLLSLKTIKPMYCRELDDPRIDTYYISINQNYYMALNGLCDECDSVKIYNDNNIKYNIMTYQGLENFVNNEEPWDDTKHNIVFELELKTFNVNINRNKNEQMNDLVLLLTNTVKSIVHFSI